MSDEDTNGDLTPEQIDELKAKYPDVELELFPTPLGPVVIKCPTDPAWRSFSARVTTEDTDRNVVMLEFVTEHVAFPSREEFQKIRRRKPAVVQALSIKLQQLAGAKLLGEGKKL